MASLCWFQRWHKYQVNSAVGRAVFITNTKVRAFVAGMKCFSSKTTARRFHQKCSTIYVFHYRLLLNIFLHTSFQKLRLFTLNLRIYWLRLFASAFLSSDFLSVHNLWFQNVNLRSYRFLTFSFLNSWKWKDFV